MNKQNKQADIKNTSNTNRKKKTKREDSVAYVYLSGWGKECSFFALHILRGTMSRTLAEFREFEV